MDITDTLTPKSDQLDAVDLASTGPRIFTVKSVSKGDPEQPVNVHLVEFPRGPWRPGKNMRRVLAACWGADASTWVGRAVELYCDPSVMFGKEAVGGIRVKRLSHISGQQKIPLIVSRGKSAVYTVRPIEASPSTRGGAESGTGASQPEAETPTEPNPLMVAVNKQIKAMATAGQTAFLSTWCQHHGVKPSSAAIVEKWGADALDLHALMAANPTDGATA